MKTYAESLRDAGGLWPEAVVLNVDCGRAMQTALFAEAYPERTFNCGIAEQNAVGVASGLAIEGMVPLLHGYSPFLIRRALDQLVASCMQRGNGIKVVGGLFGITGGALGRSHHEIGDVAALRSATDFVVLEPCDAREVATVLAAAINHPGPVYIRLRRDTPPLLEEDGGAVPFSIGKGRVLRRGGDAALIGAGVMTETALAAAELLETEGVRCTVIHLPTIWPLDEGLIRDAVRNHAVTVVIENHCIFGGTAGAVAELAALEGAGRVLAAGVRRTAYPAGDRDYLETQMRMGAKDIAAEVRNALLRGAQ